MGTHVAYPVDVALLRERFNFDTRALVRVARDERATVVRSFLLSTGRDKIEAMQTTWRSVLCAGR